MIEGNKKIEKYYGCRLEVPRSPSNSDRIAVGILAPPKILPRQGIRATRVGENSTLGKIVSLIHDAEEHQARIVRTADAFAKWFTPAILALACGVWLVSGDFVRCVSVLVVGCP